MWSLPVILHSPSLEAEEATASPSPSTVPQAVDLGEIRVDDTPLRQGPLDAPSNFVSVIHPKEFEGEFKTTSELLEKTVGVRVIDFGGLGQRQTISIRGSSAEQVVVLLDGVRLNTGQRGGVDIASIPVEMIERIEVSRGGESAAVGTDALGGVVNIITRKGTKGSQTTGELSYGSFHTWKGAVTEGFKVGNFDGFLSHTHILTDGDFPFLDTNFREARRINNESISESPFVRFGYDAPGAGRFEISDQFFWSQRGQPGFGQNQLPLSESKDMRNVFNIRFERKKFFHDSITLNSQAFVRNDETKYFNPVPLIGPSAASDTKSKSYGGDVRLQYFWAPAQILSLSAEFRNDEADILSNSSGALAFQNFSVERFTYAFVLKDEMSLWNDWVTLLPTLRFEDSTKFEPQWVPKFGLKVSPLKWLAFKGNVGRVFRLPNFDELYFPESEFIGGNPNLIPEEGISGDVGFEINTEPFFFSASVFYSQVGNSIFFVPISATRIEPINFRDDTISQGVELAAQWDPVQYLSLRANYTFLDHYFQTTGFHLPGRAVHNVDFRTTVKYPPWVEVFFEGKYLSEFSVVLPAAGGFLEPERLIFNTGATVSPLEWLKVSVEVDDVNNERGINDSRDFPLPERRFMGTVLVKF